MARERIILGGVSGAGKTTAWLTIARYNPTSQFYVVEPDDGYIKVATLEFPDVVKNGNVHGAIDLNTPDFVNNWTNFRKFVNKIRELQAKNVLTENDWVVIEGIDIVTRNIRYEYLERVNEGKSDRDTHRVYADAWDAIISKRRGGAPVLDPSDHDAVNYEYEKQMTYLAYTIPTNVLATAGITNISFDSKFEKDEVKEFYTALGTRMKLEGHARNPRMFDTLIYLYPPAVSGQSYGYEVLKDRGISGRQTKINFSSGIDFWLSFTQARAKILSAKQQIGVQ